MKTETRLTSRSGNRPNQSETSWAIIIRTATVQFTKRWFVWANIGSCVSLWSKCTATTVPWMAILRLPCATRKRACQKLRLRCWKTSTKKRLKWFRTSMIPNLNRPFCRHDFQICWLTEQREFLRDMRRRFRRTTFPKQFRQRFIWWIILKPSWTISWNSSRDPISRRAESCSAWTVSKKLMKRDAARQCWGPGR